MLESKICLKKCSPQSQKLQMDGGTMVAHWERVQTQRCSADRMKPFTLSAKEQGKERGGVRLSEYKGGAG